MGYKFVLLFMNVMLFFGLAHVFMVFMVTAYSILLITPFQALAMAQAS